MSRLIKIIDKNSGDILSEFPIEDLQKAYEYAKNMELCDIEVNLEIPTITNTLASSLGISEEDQIKFQDSVDKEWQDHD